jgi:hypothetical protein
MPKQLLDEARVNHQAFAVTPLTKRQEEREKCSAIGHFST